MRIVLTLDGSSSMIQGRDLRTTVIAAENLMRQHGLTKATVITTDAVEIKQIERACSYLRDVGNDIILGRIMAKEGPEIDLYALARYPRRTA